MIDILDLHKDSIISRTYGIKQVLEQLKTDNFDISSASVLDIFAGDGSYCSFMLGDVAKDIDCISTSEEDLKNVCRLMPNATTILGDSFEVIEQIEKRYDIIFCDNPQGILPNGRSEYFDLLNKIPDRLNTGGYFIHNVNVLPYNYDKNSLWSNIRDKFYKTSAENLNLEYVKQFHIEQMSSLGLKTDYVKLIPREKVNSKVYLYFLLYKGL